MMKQSVHRVASSSLSLSSSSSLYNHNNNNNNYYYYYLYNLIRSFLIIGIVVLSIFDVYIVLTEPSFWDWYTKNSSRIRHHPIGPFTIYLKSHGFLLDSTWTYHHRTKNIYNNNNNTTTKSSSRSNNPEQSEQVIDKEPKTTKKGGKAYVIELLVRAGISRTEIQAKINQLPTWESIEELYGTKPILVGYNEGICSYYQQTVRGIDRIIGAAGMFSTGTNLVTQLLKRNCYIPERYEQYGNTPNKELLGIRWQVPWGKHTPAHYKWNHSTVSASNVNKTAVLPIVTIRNPWRWMQSMCHHPYAAKWNHITTCPNLRIPNTTTNVGDNHNNTSYSWNEVTVKYGAGTETYLSLQHLWNDWYNEYYTIQQQLRMKMEEPLLLASALSFSYPLLMIRMEDLIFYTEETITAVCSCAGGTIRTDQPFQYIMESAKGTDGKAHDISIGYLEAWIHYSQPLQPGAGFTYDDYRTSLEVVDRNLIRTFHYNIPKPPP